MDKIDYLENIKKSDKIKRVILFGADGFGSFVLKKDKSLFKRILSESQYTLNCRADFPTVSSSNWNTILTGTTVSSHGYLRWNSKYPEISPTVENEYERFPSIFYNIKKTDENNKTASFVTWSTLNDLLEPNIIDKRVKNTTLFDKEVSCEEADKAGLVASIKHFIENKPTFMFMHFDNLDHIGHAHEYQSDEYVEATKKVEENLELLLSSLKKSQLDEETLVVLASDHGGFCKDHDMFVNMSKDMDKKQMWDMTYTTAVVPLIFINPNLKNKGEIKEVVHNWDIAPTISKILGIKFPAGAVGKPISSVEI